MFYSDEGTDVMTIREQVTEARTRAWCEAFALRVQGRAAEAAQCVTFATMFERLLVRLP